MLGVELAVILNTKLGPTDCNLLDSKLVLQKVPTVGSKLGILEGKTHVNTLEANDVTTDEKKLACRKFPVILPRGADNAPYSSTSEQSQSSPPAIG